MVQAQRHACFGGFVERGDFARTAQDAQTMEEDLGDCGGTVLYGRILGEPAAAHGPQAEIQGGSGIRTKAMHSDFSSTSMSMRLIQSVPLDRTDEVFVTTLASIPAKLTF